MNLPARARQQQDAQDSRFLEGEREAQQHSHDLRQELSLPNLVFTQVLAILGLAWIGTAGKLGTAHLAFWLAAIFLFYLPSAFTVIHLSNEMPLEGGLYQWAKLRFNEMTGFLVALNLWFFNVVFISEMGLLFANNLAYILGPSYAWVSESKPLLAAASVIITLMLIWVARIGLSVGKWIHGFGGFMILFLFAAMACVAIPRWFTGAVAHPPLSLAIPAFTLFNLNILGKMGFGAMGGFDAVSIFAGECRGTDAAAVIRRSVWISAPIIAASFIIGTACVLVFSKPDEIDLISPITQVLSRGMQAMGLSTSIVALVPSLIVLTLIGQAVLSFNSCVRLPMVAGWDHLLPGWFTVLHPKYKTPVGSIAAVGALTLIIALLTVLGAGSQESYQILQNANGIAYGLAYLVMFAIPLAAPGEKPSWPLRGAALSGFLMTLLNIVTAVFPIVDVQNRVTFALKVGGVVIVLNILGVLFYLRADSRRRA
jgi:amino acid transporter